MRRWFYIFSLNLWLFAQPIFGGGAPRTYDIGLKEQVDSLKQDARSGVIPFAAINQTFRLDQHSEYLVDPTAKLTIGNLQGFPSIEFKSFQGNSPNFGYNKSSVWFRFSLNQIPDLNVPLVILLEYPHIDNITLYLPQVDGSYTAKSTGRAFPISQRQLDNRLPLFLWRPQPYMNNQFIYLNCQTSSSMMLPMKMMHLTEYANSVYHLQLISGIYLGAMLIMAIYNFTFFVMTRSTKYGVYVLYIIAITMLTLVLNGYGFEYLWPNAVKFNKNAAIPFFISLASVTAVWFFLSSLPILQSSRRLKITAHGLVCIASISCGLAFILPYRISISIAIPIVAINALFIVGLTVYFSILKDRTSRFYLASFLPLLVTILIVIAKSFGYLPINFFTEAIPNFGTALQDALLTFALADQYHQIQKESELAQGKLLVLQEEVITILDRKVEERSRDIRLIMQTIEQGIFTISGQPPRINSEYSEYLKVILKTEEIAHCSPFSLLFKNSTLTKDLILQTEHIIQTSIGEDPLNFDLNSGLLISEFDRINDDGSQQSFQLDWTPKNSDQNIVTNILVTIRDITMFKNLERHAELQSIEMKRIEELLAIKPDRLNKFTKKAAQFIDISMEAIAQGRNSKTIKSVAIMLHTLKGDSRVLGLSAISSFIHETETLIGDTYESSAANLSLIIEKLQNLSSLIMEYEQLAREKLGWGQTFERSLSGPQLQNVLEFFLNTPELQIPRAIRIPFNQAKETVRSICFETLPTLLADIVESLAPIAEHLNKSKPDVVYDLEPHTHIHSFHQNALRNAFLHILRNSLDHGIESATNRLDSGKKAQGCLLIKSSSTAQSLSITYQDDGRGLNLEKILNKARQKGLVAPSDQPDDTTIAQLIFVSGFSTTENVSEISGRGIGMDAAKCFIEEVGGTIEIELLKVMIHRQVPFQIKICLPCVYQENQSPNI